jgi:hypothetical protein
MNQIIYFSSDHEESFAVAIKIPNSKHRMFKLVFKDLYENTFYTDVESGRWIEEDLGFTDLAALIGTQLDKMAAPSIHVHKLLTWHHEYVNGRMLHFGFFNFSKNEYRMYEIFNSNRKYMYTLMEMENEEWQILGNNHEFKTGIDLRFVEEIVKILPLYWMSNNR